ncbi:MAG TPA: DUF1993 domain-containing protein [Steroidobacteraceae bacterium]|nr:DUF1993 domain-containing protein [Steroidobacteraceae bacterium]
MTISMYRASVPVFKQMLGNLDAILDKAKTYAEARKIDPNALLTARLAPDMFHLIRQIQVASDQAKGCAARLAGIDPPKYEDNEKTFDELKERLAKTIAFLDSIKPQQIDGSEERKIVLTLGGQERSFSGLDYLLGYGTPNVYFHVTAAYMILRHNGLEIGKRDYLAGRR